jgi:hypothetical protein
MWGKAPGHRRGCFSPSFPAEADRTTLPLPVAAEPWVAPQPLSLRSRSARPGQRGLPAPRAPPRLPPVLQSHASDGCPAGRARAAAECSGARPQPSPVGPRPAPATRVGSPRGRFQDLKPVPRRVQPTPRGKPPARIEFLYPARDEVLVHVDSRLSSPPDGGLACLLPLMARPRAARAHRRDRWRARVDPGGASQSWISNGTTAMFEATP